MDDLVTKLRQTFHWHAAEAAAKQQPAATVREAILEAVAPAAQSLPGKVFAIVHTKSRNGLKVCCWRGSVALGRADAATMPI